MNGSPLSQAEENPWVDVSEPATVQHNITSQEATSNQLDSSSSTRSSPEKHYHNSLTQTVSTSSASLSPNMKTPKHIRTTSSSSPKKIAKNLLPAAELSTHSYDRTQQRLQRSPSKKVSHINGHAKDLIFGVCIVNFHHLRGPEIEYSKFANNNDEDKSLIWPYLPFQALPDGAHSFEETFSYFTLYYNEKGNHKTIDKNSTTLFAISCVRQIRSDELIEKDKDITRSSVQKSVVVILRQPIYGQIKEKLSIVTNAFFEQKNFNDRIIVDLLYENLQTIYSEETSFIDENDFYSGISLRNLIKDFKKDVLVIVKAMLLEKKVAFYGSNPTNLCLTEFAFISLIPNLINNLLDSSSPELNNYAKNLKMTTSFQTSDRNSVLDFAGFPLQIFGEGGVFAPYAPLQQFDDLTKIEYYVMGTSNALILNQKSKLADVLINIDTLSVEIINHDLVQPLTLSSYDKKWMSQINNYVTSSWSDSYSGYLGSDDYIRWQFEDYLIGLLSSSKYDNFLKKFDGSPPTELLIKEVDTNQLKHYNNNFVESWKKTRNYKLFNEFTDDNIFDVFDPKHVYVDESKSLSEKFQMFKLENSKKFEEYRKGLLNKDHKDHKDHKDIKVNTESTEKSEAEPDTHKKLHSPGKIWSWYSRKKDRESD